VNLSPDPADGASGVCEMLVQRGITVTLETASA